MKIAIFGSDKHRFNSVYTPAVLERLKGFGEVSPLIDKGNVKNHKEFLADCEYAFSTWGMPAFTKEEIKEYMPCLKAVFYSAGTVQYFARPFLESGIKVFSAFAANAVPVTEYTLAQIILASKGFFQASKCYKPLLVRSFIHSKTAPGNYGIKVGLIGLGAIGKEVAKRLQMLEVQVLACDPFVPEETAKALGVTLVDMETVFSECDVISNHLADKKELKNIFNYSLFSRMKKHSVFINTGRGNQIKEGDLARWLIRNPSITFVGDVLKNELRPFTSPLFWCHNAILTPHIAGSMGNETQRMAHYMMDEFAKMLEGEETQYEITLESLERMA